MKNNWEKEFDMWWERIKHWDKEKIKGALNPTIETILTHEREQFLEIVGEDRDEIDEKMYEILVGLNRKRGYNDAKKEIRDKIKELGIEEGNCQECGEPLNNAEGELCLKCKVGKANV